jgi:hypothetical protein
VVITYRPTRCCAGVGDWSIPISLNHLVRLGQGRKSHTPTEQAAPEHTRESSDSSDSATATRRIWFSCPRAGCVRRALPCGHPWKSNIARKSVPESIAKCGPQTFPRPDAGGSAHVQGMSTKSDQADEQALDAQIRLGSLIHPRVALSF